MAVKAKAEITLSHMIDVVGTYRYYMLVSTTANAPNRPSAADYPPPALLQNTNWTTVEPSYEEGSTSSLYFVDCSVYSNGTCYYSEVSLSSSYEFSKAAYEKAVNAGITANDAHKKAEDAEKIANAGAKKIFTHVRNYTRANWQTYGAAGHSKSWTTGASYDNTHIHVGDIAYIAGTVSDAGGSNTVSAMIYGTVTAVTTSAVVMTSLYYIMGGEGGAYAKANAAQLYAENLSATINAELSNINVKFNDKVGFTDVDGSKTATIIDGGVIKTNTINANRIITSTLTALGAVTAGSFNLGNGKFKVTSDGTLTCTGAAISGDITATSFIVMDGSTEAASFTADDIYLGDDSYRATIHLSGIGRIYARESNAGWAVNDLLWLEAPNIYVRAENNARFGVGESSSFYADLQISARSLTDCEAILSANTEKITVSSTGISFTSRTYVDIGGAKISSMYLGGTLITATAAELNYCDGVTSNIQTQLNGKAASSHSHSGYAASSHNHDGTYLKQYGLNGCNIDTTGGSWTVDISTTGYGTIPATWVNVTQTTSGHFLTQVAIKCDNSASATRAGRQMWIRDKYASKAWSEWRSIAGYKVLYDNSTGTTGTVTLNETAANFSMLEIIVGFSDTGACGSLKVYSPNGKTVDVGGITATSSGANVNRVRYAISGTTMTASNNYKASWTTATSHTFTTNGLYCKQVIGYK